MRRETRTPRRDWRRTVTAQGLDFDTPAAQSAPARAYWDESTRYVFTTDEIRALESAVRLLHSMFLEAVDGVVRDQRYAELGIPKWLWPHITRSWLRRDPHLLGRFDLAYDGHGHVKLLEYNADTPTTLLEASVLQRHWLADVHPRRRQWNSIHERLLKRWCEIREHLPPGAVHFAWPGTEPTGEFHATCRYLQDTAVAAGLDTTDLTYEDLTWNRSIHRFVDPEGSPVTSVTKLRSWVLIIDEQDSETIVESLPQTCWIEPLWKMLLSYKSLLAILWENHPGHPNLLPAFVGDPGPLTEYVRKPVIGQCGENIKIVADRDRTSTGGEFGSGAYIYQGFSPLPDFDGFRPVIGAWVVGDHPAGLGIRESTGPITDDDASFIPHHILDR
ncbi:glutathionylspermidine synthase family protein [Nocardia colli]|uniref:Glutathionylspermidine synthase family protein n=1 Tax=Nocardia colli TaxID=2545717 RepID=A0A5N0EFK9_9NOCA|nr:glutathionylspermidine synthase family protein [Nocardia colli]KAA8887610.1 glutathionylspermidine synthase family protein [Nocardia colli]